MPSPVNIIGQGAICCLGAGAGRLFSGWQAGHCGLGPMRRFSPARYQTGIAGEVDDAWLGSAGPRVLRLASGAMREALEQARGAGLSKTVLQGAMLVLATAKGQVGPLETFVQRSELGDEPGSDPQVLALRLAEEAGVQGPVHAVSLACASGAAALAFAAEHILAREVDAAIVVGAEALSDFVLTGFSSLKSLSPGPCRPFDQDRQGLTLGEAGATLVLVSADLAGLQPQARLTGWGFAQDAVHATAPDREGRGLAMAITRALKRAGVQPGDIHYINAHGTGTPYNDAMEAKAVASVFGLPGPPLSTLKGSCGHTLGVAGVLEAVVTCQVARERWAPATVGLLQPGVEEKLDLIIREGRGLQARPCAMSLSAGFGGFNAALVIESAAA